MWMATAMNSQMKYKEFIEKYFLIDEAKTGKLVPFIFNKVQDKYYQELIQESKGTIRLDIPLREMVLKARREGFTSFILAMFAADMILNRDPTYAQEISYKDAATRQHFKRFRVFLESYFVKKGITDLSDVLETDNRHEIVLKENRATFYVGSASGRTGERGGTVQKLLFSEAAHYPDTQNMTATEVINATMRQVDQAAGWVFLESTANGTGNEFYRMWKQASEGISRFKPRFYGWREFYTEEQFKIIDSEFTDKEMVKQEYPETAEEAFLSAKRGVIYAKELAEARRNGRVRPVPYDPILKVHTVWDLGIGPKMAIGFYQASGSERRMIDYWEGTGKEGLPEAISIVQNKHYVYGKHFGPHDIESADIGTGKSRIETARVLGFNFEIVPKVSIPDGINAGKMLLAKLFIDETNCDQWLQHMAKHHRSWNEKKDDYDEKPVKDGTNHAADVHKYAGLVEQLMDNDEIDPSQFNLYGKSYR